MPSPPAEQRDLAALPAADRSLLLEEAVLAAVRHQLFLTDRDEVPLDENYFDLGLGSLHLTELKEHLERRFGCRIDTVWLFNNPTLDHLLEHLDDLVTRNHGDGRG
ncbi:acyl carrier protein [Streptomyces sp. NPDC055607]